MVVAIVGGLVLDGTDARATYTIGEDGLVGWFDGVASRVKQDELTNQDGLVDARGYLSGRMITIEGAVITATPAQQEEARRALSSVLADGSAGRLTVRSSTGEKFAMVRRVGEPSFVTQVWGKRAEYQVQFSARDPRRYADAAFLLTGPPTSGMGETWPLTWPRVWPSGGTNGRIALDNVGETSSPAVTFRLHGGFATATITCVETGARVGFTRPVPEGDFVEIDVEQRRALYNGISDVSRWLAFREWEQIPARSTRAYQFDVTSPSGAPFMEGRVLSAWL
jgi:hypothetical protein